MDANVEMVPTNRRGSHVVSAVDLDMTLPSDFVSSPRGGGRVVLLVTTLILALAVSVLGVFYLRNDVVEVSLSDPNSQTDESLPDGHTEDGTDTSSHDSTDSSKPGGMTEKDISEWLDATVTVKDGIKYEIVGEIEHDPTAFTYVFQILCCIDLLVSA
jgi:hypothetical protein